MSTNLRALVVVLGISIFVLALFWPSARENCAGADYGRRAMLWVGLSLVGFLAPNFWFYTLSMALLMVFFAPKDPNRAALYLFLAFALPPIPMEIPGFGVVRYLFALDHLRLLALTVLMPIVLRPRTAGPADARLGRSPVNRLVVAYLVYLCLLQVALTTLTDAARQSFYYFLDVFLPFYVVSRTVRNMQAVRESATMLLAAACVVAAIAIFEFGKHWLLYSTLAESLEARWGYANYLPRGEALRALATTGHPIALGYFLVVAMGFGLFLYLTSPQRTRARWLPWLALLLAGLIAALSRGPWLGLAVLVVAYLATAPKVTGRLLLTVAALPALGGLVMLTPAGETIIEHLPFVGSVDSENVTYRQRLIEICWLIIQEYPLFGIPFFLNRPEMQSLRQGQGIIDIVNSYLGLALNSGLIGLTLFLAVFVTLAVCVFRASRRLAAIDHDLHILGRMIFAIVVSILVMIGTVSSITVIPMIYWSVVGLGVAYLGMANRRIEETVPQAHPQDMVAGESRLEHA